MGFFLSQPVSLSPEQLEQLRQSLLADAAARQQTANGNTPVPPAFTVTRGDQQYQVHDQAELQRLLDEADRQRDAALQAEQVRAQALEQQLAAFQAQQAAAQRPAQQPAEFDKEQYAKLFLEDPRKAQIYMWQHDDNVKQFFGGVAAKVTQLEQTLDEERQQRSAERFMDRNGDYVATPENFQALEAIIKENGLPWTDASLGLAWAFAKEQGVVSVYEPEVGAPAELDIAPPSFPSRRSSQIEPDDIMRQFETMSPDAQKKYLESISA